MADIEQPEQTGVTRRTVTKAMAWAVPAVAIATAAPLTAASPVCLDSGVCFGDAEIGKWCNVEPENSYWACVEFTNNSGVDVTIDFSFDLSTSANGVVAFAGGGTVAAHSTETFLVKVYENKAGQGFANCSNGTYDDFDVAFSDGINNGVATVLGGSTGGNRAPECA
jgi:hypothetical protein